MIRVPPAVAAAAAVAAFAIGLARGTFVAGGSDSACYLGAAQQFATGTLRVEAPLARSAPWEDAGRAFAPAGHIPSPVDPATFVPMCPPGLPLLMAAFRLVHISMFAVVPLLGGLTVWLTYVLGRTIDRPLTGAAAAVLTACSPIFLYQVVQPMTDVPAAAWWLLAMVLVVTSSRRTPYAFGAGLAASVATLTRPNLVPLAAVLLVYLIATGPSGQRLRLALSFGLGLLPGIALVALLQRAMYGSPLATGYGAAETLFAVSNIVPNIRRYTAWLVQAHTPVLLLALAAPVLLRRAADGWLCLAMAVVTLACYLPYVVFDDWWYIRFLLPAIPPLIVSSVAVMVAVFERVAIRRGPQLAVASTAILAIVWVQFARSSHAFDLAEWEHHYARAGRFVAERLPDRAAVVTMKNSGSVHYYSGRPTISWDVVTPSSLDTAISFVKSQGYAPYLLLESDEEPLFRAKFRSASRWGELDWPPLAQIGRTIRVYDPFDRARFMADGGVKTEFIW